MPALRSLGLGLTLLTGLLLAGIAAAPRARADGGDPGAAAPAAAEAPAVAETPAVPEATWWKLEIQATAQPMANPIGGTQRSAGSIQELDLGLSFGSGLGGGPDFPREIDRWKLLLGASLYAGDAELSERLGALFPLQSSANPPGLWLTRLAVERQAGVGELGLLAGLATLDPAFLVAPAYDSYIHSAFNQTLNLSIAGTPVSPFAAPALVLHYRPTPQWQWRLGVFAPQGAPGGFRLAGPRPVALSPLPVEGRWLGILQVENSWPASDPRLRGSAVAAMLPDGLLQLGGFSGRGSGTYASLTLPLELPIGLANRIWAAASVGLDPSSNPVPLYGQLGWLSQGVLAGRPRDVLAVGFGRSSLSPLVIGSYEAVLEANYAMALGGGLTLQPGLQWIANPGGQGQLPGILAATVQLQFSY